MIKLIAFDLVGVLVNEKDIELTTEEDKLERMFGKNINDSDYLLEARKIINKDSILMRTIENLINKLYQVKDVDLFKKIKEKNSSIKIIIATNHVSYIKDFIKENFEAKYLDHILISSEIHKVKPNADFYEYILEEFKILPEELLFLDDNIENIESAKKLGINTIKVDKNTDLYEKILLWLDNDR